MQQVLRIGVRHVHQLRALLREDPVEERLGLVLRVVGADAHVVDPDSLDEIVYSVHIVIQRRLEPVAQKRRERVGSDHTTSLRD